MHHRTFVDEQLALESELENVNNSIKTVTSETTRKLKELNDAQLAQRIRQSQIIRLSSLSRPVDHDITYFVTDKHVPSSREAIDDNQVSFQQKYIKIARSGELIQLEAKLLEANANVQKGFAELEEKLSQEKTPKSSAFIVPTFPVEERLDVVPYAIITASSSIGNL